MKAFPERVVRCVVVLPLLLVACARQPGAAQAADAAAMATGAAAPMAEDAFAPPAPPAPMMLARAAPRPASEPVPVSPEQLASSANAYTDGQRRFVRTADARFRVRDTYAAALAIEDLVARQHGFVVLNDINAHVLDTRQRSIGHQRLLEVAEYTVNGTLTVRVPSENTQALLRAMAAQVEFLDARRFQADDVQFDLLAQTQAERRDAQAEQELGQASARNARADQLVAVIESRRQARERRDGALVEQRRTEDRIAFSTLTFSLYQPSMIRRTELPDVAAVLDDNAPSFLWRLGQSLRGGWEGAQALALRLALAWPLWLVLAAVALGVRAGLRLLRRRAPR
ncbi:DUF4349 domain-containing protein [Pseudoxanthomonas sp.]|uniref:DUF4349 domain-containing protein n=1 Tax=Pseudoxanthomonas sp. TaxID=1871049 RepID=UPI00260DD77E|nr:DUF4349 domain-containing protein [Pseudoxanthomonas sp.]WDS34861.1 MAG: DUF4349 domain-containing protein [Pseudoxanthomonas sp.]